MGSDLGQDIIRSTAFDLALEKPYLMHAVNGVSAAHLCHLLPQAQHPVQYHQSKLTSLYHWRKALPLLRDELAAGVNPKNMDAMISTVMLIAVHQFTRTEALPDPSNSFVYAPMAERKERLGWLPIQHGFKAVQAELGEVIWKSAWKPVFMDADVKKYAKLMTPEAGDKTHAIFLELCEIEQGSSVQNNPYYESLQFLFFLRRLKPGRSSFNKLVTFVAVIEKDYLRLLLEREKRALLILVHWLALLSEIEQWWASSRCTSECIAIVTFLMHDRDARVRELLKFPARMVGICLTSVTDSLIVST